MQFMKHRLWRGGLLWAVVVAVLISGCGDDAHSGQTAGGSVKLTGPARDAAGQLEQLVQAVDDDEGVKTGETKRFVDLLGRAAEAGDVWAAFYLARAHLTKWNRVPVQPDFESDLAPARAEIYHQTVRYIIRDHGVNFDADDRAEVVKLLHRYASVDEPEQGHPRIAAMLGTFYARGLTDGAPDPAMAAKLYRQSAERGDAFGQAGYAASLVNGLGVPRDPERGAALARQSAEAGYGWGMYVYGYCFEIGAGVEQDYLEAIQWFSRAGSMGHHVAGAHTGMLMLRGDGLPQDVEAGLAFLEAASLGSGHAAQRLGWVYYTGEHVEKDYEQAARKFKVAAYHRNAEGHRMYAWCLANGQGVQRDGAEALLSMNAWAHRTVTRKQAATWAKRYRAAKWISEAELYRQLPGVRIEVDVVETMADWLSEKRAKSLAASVAQARGLKVDREAPFTLRVVVRGALKQNTAVNSLGVMVSIQTDTPVRRDKQGFWNLPVSLAERTTYSAGQVRLSRRIVDNLFRHNVGACLEMIRDDKQREPEAGYEKSWKNSLWPAEQDLVMRRTYVRAAEFKRSLKKYWAQDVDSYRWVGATLNQIEHADRVMSKRSLDRMWNDAWADSDRPKNSNSRFFVRHRLAGLRYSKPPFLLSRFYYTLTSHLQVQQNHIVFMLNDEYRRLSTGVIRHGYVVHPCREKDATDRARVLTELAIEQAF